MTRFFFILMAIICLGCKQNAEKDTAKPAVEQKVTKKIPEGPLAQKLYANYHFTPSNQKQIDENKLIEYAVDKNLDVSRTNTGLYYIITKTNDSPVFTINQPISANYRGTLLTGKEFDSSYKRGKPIDFKVGQMIPGWNEALLMMNKGSKATLLIPSDLAYGPNGFTGFIGPNEALVFEIEIPETF